MIQLEEKGTQKKVSPRKPLALSNINLKDLEEQSIFQYLSYFSSIKQFKETQQGLDLRRALLAHPNQKKLEKVIKILYNFAHHARSEAKICVLQFIRQLVDSVPKLKIIQAIQRYFLGSVIDAVQYRCHVKSVSRGSCFFNQMMNKQVKDNDFMEVVKLSNTYCRMNYQFLYILGEKYLPSSNFGIIYKKLMKYCRFPEYPQEFRFYMNTEKVSEISKKMKGMNDIFRTRKTAPPISERSNKSKKKDEKRGDQIGKEKQENQQKQTYGNIQREAQSSIRKKDLRVSNQKQRQEIKQREKKDEKKQRQKARISEKNNHQQSVPQAQEIDKLRSGKQIMKIQSLEIDPKINSQKGDNKKTDINPKLVFQPKGGNLLPQKQQDIVQKQRKEQPGSNPQVKEEKIIQQLEEENEEDLFESERVEKSVFLAKPSKIVSRPSNKKMVQRNIIYRSSPIQDPDDITESNEMRKKVKGRIDAPLSTIQEIPSKENKDSSRSERDKNPSGGQKQQKGNQKDKDWGQKEQEFQDMNNLKYPPKPTIKVKKIEKEEKDNKNEKELIIQKEVKDIQFVISEQNSNDPHIGSVKQQIQEFELDKKAKEQNERSYKLIETSLIRQRVDSQGSNQSKKKQQQVKINYQRNKKQQVLIQAPNLDLQARENEIEKQPQRQPLKTWKQIQTQELELDLEKKKIEYDLNKEQQSICEVQQITLSKLDREVNNRGRKDPKAIAQPKQREIIPVETVSLSRIIGNQEKVTNKIERKTANTWIHNNGFSLPKGNQQTNQKMPDAQNGKPRKHDQIQKPSSSRKLKSKKKLFSEAEFEQSGAPNSQVQNTVKKLTINHVYDVKENLFGSAQGTDIDRGNRNQFSKSNGKLRKFREIALTIIPEHRKQQQQAEKEMRQIERIGYEKMKIQIMDRFSQFERKSLDKNEQQISKLKQFIESSKLIETPSKIPLRKGDGISMGEDHSSRKKSKVFFQGRTQSKSKTRSNSLTRSNLSQIKNKKDIYLYCEEGTMLFLMAKKKSVII